jgi:hypothetical protein
MGTALHGNTAAWLDSITNSPREWCVDSIITTLFIWARTPPRGGGSLTHEGGGGWFIEKNTRAPRWKNKGPSGLGIGPLASSLKLDFDAQVFLREAWRRRN